MMEPIYGPNDCTCRWEMQHCDNENDAWDMLNGVCICVEQPCEEADFYFDFNDCNCKCLDMKECADQEWYGENKLMLWAN